MQDGLRATRVMQEDLTRVTAAAVHEGWISKAEVIRDQGQGERDLEETAEMYSSPLSTLIAKQHRSPSLPGERPAQACPSGICMFVWSVIGALGPG